MNWFQVKDRRWLRRFSHLKRRNFTSLSYLAVMASTLALNFLEVVRNLTTAYLGLRRVLAQYSSPSRECFVRGVHQPAPSPCDRFSRLRLL